MTTPTSPQKHILNIEFIGDHRDDKRWAKALTGVDCSKSDGYAFEGQFINEGLNELSVGVYILYFVHYGKPGYKKVAISVTQIDPTRKSGERVIISEEDIPASGWSLHVRDRIAKLFEQPEPEQATESNPFDQFSDDQILAEANRRGII